MLRHVGAYSVAQTHLVTQQYSLHLVSPPFPAIARLALEAGLRASDAARKVWVRSVRRRPHTHCSGGSTASIRIRTGLPRNRLSAVVAGLSNDRDHVDGLGLHPPDQRHDGHGQGIAVGFSRNGHEPQRAAADQIACSPCCCFVRRLSGHRLVLLVKPATFLFARSQRLARQHGKRQQRWRRRRRKGQEEWKPTPRRHADRATQHKDDATH